MASTWVQLETQEACKIGKVIYKTESYLVCWLWFMFLICFGFWILFLCTLGAKLQCLLGRTLLQNPYEMVLGWVMKVLPVFGLGGVLRGLGASWKPTADFDRILIHFWCTFRLLKTFNVLLVCSFVGCPLVWYFVRCSSVKPLCQSIKKWTRSKSSGSLSCWEMGGGWSGCWSEVQGWSALFSTWWTSVVQELHLIVAFSKEYRRCILRRAARFRRLYQQQVACPARL